MALWNAAQIKTQDGASENQKTTLHIVAKNGKQRKEKTMNRCDVSGVETKCRLIEGACAYQRKSDAWFCVFEYGETCACLAAIRAAIEVEGMKINCPDCGSEKTLLCNCWKEEPGADDSKGVKL
jgi:hypothetical protein